MQYVNSSQTSSLLLPTESDTTPIAVTTGTTQAPYCFMREGTLHSDVDAKISSLSGDKLNDMDRLQQFCSLRDLAAAEHQDKFELALTIDRESSGQWSYSFLVNKIPVFTSEQHLIGDGSDVAAFESEKLRQIFSDPVLFDDLTAAIQSFRSNISETSSQAEVLAAFQSFKSVVPQGGANRLEIGVEHTLAPAKGTEPAKIESSTYRFDVRGDRGVMTMYRSAPLSPTSSPNVLAYASYFGALQQLRTEMRERGYLLAAFPDFVRFLEANERPFQSIVPASDTHRIQAKAFELVASIASQFGINASTNLIEGGKFQLTMEDKVLYEGEIRRRAMFDLLGENACVAITRSAAKVAQMRIKPAYESIMQNFAAYRNIDSTGAVGQSLQDALQNEADPVLKIDVRNVVDPMGGPLAFLYELDVHSEAGGVRQFSMMGSAATNLNVNYSEPHALQLLKGLCADTKRQIVEMAGPLAEDQDDVTMILEDLGNIVFPGGYSILATF